MEERVQEQMSAFERYERGLFLKEVKVFDQALEDFRQAAADPQYAGKAHAQIGLCFRSVGRYVQAVDAFRLALKSTTFSPEERVHILYLLGRDLESLGRYAESLETYRWISGHDADFLDVAQRLAHFSSHPNDPFPRLPPDGPPWHMLRSWPDVSDRILYWLGQAWEWLGPYVERLEAYLLHRISHWRSNPDAPVRPRQPAGQFHNHTPSHKF